MQRAHGLALRVLLEEHWHQVFEYELILHPDGAGAKLGSAMQEHFQRHLYERGMLRHTPEEITAFGKADLDAVAAWLDGRDWTVADHPTLTDCSVWGLLAPSIFSPFADFLHVVCARARPDRGLRRARACPILPGARAGSGVMLVRWSTPTFEATASS